MNTAHRTLLHDTIVAYAFEKREYPLTFERAIELGRRLKLDQENTTTIEHAFRTLKRDHRKGLELDPYVKARALAACRWP